MASVLGNSTRASATPNSQVKCKFKRRRRRRSKRKGGDTLLCLLGDISDLMSTHHLKLNREKKELLFLPE
ncbi:hypothetical protein DPEC_G00074610 [Dallia pectoralis]|uniref:Uncharacterized protein n=1 Tax=Dallia pectoralis TaxID=75939 RepID=A0ACC2H2Z2_DALPE|nr:hypothetical protein DPEC_G00074610 [Dallia pectoralis]